MSIERELNCAEKLDPPWYTEFLYRLQEQEGMENLGIAGVNWDENLTYLYDYKDEIIERFNEYFALYEIGQETPQRFQFMCNRHYNAKKKVWNHRIELYINNITTQIGRINKTVKTSDILRAITGKDTEARSGSDVVTGTHGNTQNYNTSKESKEYDTPVTQISSLNDGYLSGGSGEENKTDVSGTNTINDTTTTTRDGEVTTKRDENIGEDTVIEYSFQDKPIMELIEDNINVWNDVVQSIINDCKELFINVMARI